MQLSVRRRRTDFEPDRGACVSCGRCLWYCPEEHARQEFVQIQQDEQPIESCPNRPRPFNLLSYRIAVRTATMAGIFSLVVAALMLYDFAHRSMKDPFTTTDPSRISARDALKAVLKEQPANESLKEDLRKLDLESRDEYFRQQAFALGARRTVVRRDHRLAGRSPLGGDLAERASAAEARRSTTGLGGQLDPGRAVDRRRAVRRARCCGGRIEPALAGQDGGECGWPGPRDRGEKSS